MPRLDCVYLGDHPTGELVKCLSCVSTQLQVYECSKYGKATILKRGDGIEGCCEGCKLYVSKSATGSEPPKIPEIHPQPRLVISSPQLWLIGGKLVWNGTDVITCPTCPCSIVINCHADSWFGYTVGLLPLNLVAKGAYTFVALGGATGQLVSALDQSVPSTQTILTPAPPAPSGAVNLLCLGHDGKVYGTGPGLAGFNVLQIDPTIPSIINNFAPNAAFTSCSVQSMKLGPDNFIWFSVNGTFGVVSSSWVFSMDAAGTYGGPFNTTVLVSNLVPAGGFLWGTSVVGGVPQISRLTVAGGSASAIANYPSGSFPAVWGGMVAGADGNLWIADTLNNAITKFDITSHTATPYPLTATYVPMTICNAPDGNVYCAYGIGSGGGSHRGIARCTMAGAITYCDLTSQLSGDPAFISASSANLWFRDGPNARTIYKYG